MMSFPLCPVAQNKQENKVICFFPPVAVRVFHALAFRENRQWVHEVFFFLHLHASLDVGLVLLNYSAVFRP